MAGKGKPKRWTDEAREAAVSEICDRIANGENLRTMLSGAEPHLPTQKVWYRWLTDAETSESVGTRYARAREARADIRSDRIDDYVQKAIKGEIPSDVARIAIDAEKWQAGKENQGRYGDTQRVKHEGGVNLILDCGIDVPPGEMSRRDGSDERED